MQKAADSGNGTSHLPSGKYGDTLHFGGSAQAAITDMEDPIGEAVVTCCLHGDAVFFGQTKDGTALLVRVYSSSGNGEWYVGTSEALQAVLRAIMDANRA